MSKRLLPSFLLLLAFATVAASPATGQILHDLTERTVPLSPADPVVAGKRATLTTASPAVEEPFNGVVVQGYASDPDVQGWIRFEERGGWGAWRPMRLIRSATDGTFAGGYRDEVYRSGLRFELRFAYAAGTAFHLVGAGVFDNRNDEDRQAPGGVVPHHGKKAGHIIPPPLITRAEWGAAPFRGTPSPLAPNGYEYMTFHHAAGYSATTKEEGIRQVKAIQDLHQNVRGWSDIGYQFLIDRGGHLYQGRPFLDDATSLEEVPALALGAHVGGHNTGNIGVSLLGCYHPPEGSFCQEVITPEALETYVVLFAFLSERYGVAPELIRGHRDFSSTACPGDNNYVLLPSLREDVAHLLLTGNEPLGQAVMAATVDADGVVRLSWEFIEAPGIAGYRIERTSGGITTVVTEGEGAAPGLYADAGVTKPGPVRYELYARSATGREQLLATTEVTVEAPAALYVLAQGFPNPFHRRTTIRYYLERDGIVRLHVYDATGREVRTLVEAYQRSGQWYTVPFDAAGLPAGTYFYRLRVEGFSGLDFDRTGTLVLVR
ncbi:N-acetylmuramoyl-L-alanine amidase [Rhodocaloribacter litoris]|uniref:N-acetylmuramoyl-L-alanine amidase n=1 Tax=Rhodocaloribacter litoris TaxID=2558931 RepID=UPI0014215D1F|nr:N-acetylmuramoyl-L-alanine amidase [Rhodocaloribacter litoris]QXD15622.1 N-acetylmuramoyl-L-alanine amidase [Rhodocaloribacter litoris]